MSEENKDDSKTKPMRKTSAVPLRKETVRVTLKSAPTGLTGPQAVTPPSPSVSQAPTPPAPSFPGGSAGPPAPKNPNLPDVTSAVPLKQETMRVTLKAEDEADKSEKSGPAAPPAPAPTIPLGGAVGAPKPPAAAPTVKLNTGNAVTGPATVPLATQPLQKAGSSQPLPKATVQLQQTQQLSPSESPTQAATIQTVTDEDSSARRGGNGPSILAVAVFLISLFVLFAQFQQAKVWLDSKYDGQMGPLFSASK